MTDKNGRTLYYLDGKRVSRDDYFWEYDRRSEMIDEMLDKRMDWFDKPEDIYEDATTLESVSGVERDEVADVKGIGDLADRYIDIDGATVQSVEVKQVGRSNSYYIDGKRANRDKALDACAEMRGDNLFTIEYQRGRYGDDGKIVYSTERKTMSRLDLKINAHGDGYSVHFYNGFATVHIFEEYEDAKACFNQIEAAYLAGKAGVKVDSDGTISDLDEAEELEALATKMEARILSSPAIAEKYARAKERVEVTFSKYGYPLYRYRKTSGEWTDNERVAKTYITKCGLSETEFIIKAKHDLPSGDITDAENLTAKLKDATRKAILMEIYPQVGGRIVDNLYKVEIRPDSDGFIFTNGHETFARYDTEEQCLEVIRQIGVAVEFGDSGFTFPKAAGIELELNLPALAAAHLQTYGLTLAESCGYPEAYHA